MQDSKRRSAFCLWALAAVMTFGMAACGDDEPAAVVTPVTPPTVPPFQPQSIEVALGESGQSVTLMTTEAGGHTLNGEAFASGGTHTAAVGDIEVTYTLTLADGSWSAACVCEIEVALGASGDTATVTLNDADGSFSLGGEALASGDRRLGYVFALEGGSWTASFVAVTQVVTLGLLDVGLVLTQLENGSWVGSDGAALPSGSIVTVGGNSYLLTLGEDGRWTAEYSPDTMELAGTGLTVIAREEGGYEIAGTLLEFDDDGMDSVTLETGERYLVTRNEDGTLQGARQESAAVGDGTAGHLDLADPQLANSETHLEFALDPDPQFSFEDLFADGMDEASGDGIVAGVIDDIREIRADAVLLIEALDDNQASLGTSLGNFWDAINEDLNRVFGPDPDPADGMVGDDDIGTAPDPDDFLEEVDEILAALASEDALRAADKGDGVFEREFDGDYDAREWMATAWLGSNGSTRFGVVNHTSRDYANGDPNPAQRGAFRYSTRSATSVLRQVSDRLDLSGDLLYDGETIAIDGTGAVYSGEIALQVRLGALRVNGVIENLAGQDGGLWEPSFTIAGRGVQTIILPIGRLGYNARWDHTGDAQMTVSTRAGLNQRISGEFGFRGLLLGRGDEAADEALGDWGSIVPAGSDNTADWIRGAFGASLSNVHGVRLPEVAASGALARAVIANVDPTGVGPDSPRGIDFDTRDGELLLGELRDESGARWRLDLAAAYDSQGSERLESGERWVDLARVELEVLRDRLLTFQRLDADDRDFTVLATEEGIWNDAINEVSRLLFGVNEGAANPDDMFRTGERISERFPDTSRNADPGRRYPSALIVTAGSDDAALDIIDDLLEALASKGGYREAYEDGGIFANVNEDPDGPEGPISNNDGGEDFDRVQSRVTSLAGSTALTRFGLFWGTETASAADSESLRAGLRDAEPIVAQQYSNTGLYAYSELNFVRYAADSDPTLPQGGSATYRGDAVAAYNEVLYTGTSEVLVTWQEPTERPDLLFTPRVIGRMSAAFSLERLDNSDQLVRESDGVGIDQIVFSNSLLEWRAGTRTDGTANTIGTLDRSLQEANGNGLRVEFWNRRDARYATEPLGSDDGTATGADDTDDLRQSLEATFVGRTIDSLSGVNPAGVIGYFKVQNPDPAVGEFRFTNRDSDDRVADESGTANTEALVGAFGADLVP